MSQIEKQLEKEANRIADLERDNHDLRERIRTLESRLEHAQHVSRTKSAYLENVSHEIRTSMYGIVGMASLVLETELTPEQEQYLEMVNTSVDRLLEVVNEVLDFSKIEAGNLELELQNFSLKESLDHDLYMLRLDAEQKELTLTCEIDPDVPDLVNGDPKRLVQVLTNLVDNAIRYTETGGVSIFVKNDGYDEDKRLVLHFSVRDTGRGIELEQQKQIFHCFCLTEAGQEVTNEGVGIGLIVCSKLVRLMGGEIGLASSSKGSMFWFSVPFKEVAEPGEREEDRLTALRKEETAIHALKGARVLLAEDEPINQVLTETLLSQAGVEVTSVEDGSEAVEEAFKRDYQIILMDVQMPLIDGLEATRQIRAREKKQGKRRTIIALTALATQGDREKCLQAGMDDYLPKPIEKSQLVDILTKYLTSSALVVDSDRLSQQLLVRSLIENGWNVTIAETARSAMYEASLNNFDLILLDTQMPQMDGIEAARVIRKLEEYSGRHAVIVGIGSGEEGEEQRCLASGIDRYLVRPLSRDNVGEALQVIGS